MKILLVADNLRSGGGKVVGIEYLKAFCKLFNKDNLYFILPMTIEYRDVINKFSISEKNILFVTNSTRKQRVIWLFNRKVEKFVLDNEISHIINLTNIPLPIKNVEQTLLIHKAFLVLDLKNQESINITSRRQRYRLFIEQSLLRNSLKYVSNIIVQTQYMKDLLINQYRFNPDNVKVIPSGVQQLNGVDKNTVIKKDKKTILFVPSNDYRHKNLEVLIDVAKLAKNTNKKLLFIVTLDENKTNLIKKIKNENVDDYFENVGYLTYQETQNKYNQCDALIMPTLLESFCLPLVEALKHNKPILVSNLPFAKEICGDSAIYFDPYSPIDILNKIDSFIKNSKSHSRNVYNNSYVITWEESTSKLLDSINNV